MEARILEELWRQKKAQAVRLMEVADLTRQILQAAERRDEVSVTMLLSMREEPITRLQETDAALREYLRTLSREDAIRAAELLNGAPSESPEEARLCEQVGQCRRLLESAVETDSRLSVRMGGQRSFYKMFRTNAPRPR